MKICVISSTVFSVPLGGYGGLEAIAWLSAKGLAEKGHTVSLVAPDGSYCPGVEIIPTGPAGKVHEKYAFKAYRDKLLQQDVIIDHSWSKMALSLKMENRTQIPILCVTHAPVNTMFQTLPPVEKPCFVCISQDQARHFQALFNREARVCYNGVDSEIYSPLDIPRTDRFLFLARFSSIKGADLAIEACKQADVGLDLVGDTSITQEPEYFHKCKSMCDGKQIRMIGPATRAETVYWYSQAHCMLHPNMRFREPLGLAPLEAMLCKTPVIAWDYGAMRETIKHGESGWLVTSLDEMILWITSFVSGEAGHHLWKPIDRNYCREWAKQFSIQRMVDRYEELAQEAMNTGGW